MGSSLVHKMIHADLSLMDTHGDYFSTKSRVLGNRAEQCVELELGGYPIERHLFAVSKDFPFICATPDFFVEQEDGSVILIEVKSGNSFKSAMQNSKSARSKTQVQVAMQVFGVNHAKMITVVRDDVQNLEEVVGTIDLQREDVLFKHRKAVIQGYIRYLEEFFCKIYQIEISNVLKEKLVEYLDHRIPRCRMKKIPVTMDDIREKARLSYVDKSERVCPKLIGNRFPHQLA